MTPLDFRISPGSPVTVISGLNAGGKTVALKTLGLAVMTARTGLYVPCAPGSSIDFPSLVMAVMGDNQDLDSDLSTFSGHVSALKPVLALAGPGALVLLDELGGGTDPAEGQALALAVLEELMASGAWIVSATHFHLVKTWASLTPGVVSAAVNTGADGSPAYGLSYGAPGFSGGLSMAERLGLPSRIVAKARGYLDDGHRRSLELLQRLDEARAELLAETALAKAGREEAARQLSLGRAALEKETARVARLQKEADQELRGFMSRYRAAFDRLRAEAKEAAALAAKTGGPSGFDPQRVSDVKAQMGRDAAKVLPESVAAQDAPPAPRDLKPGDTVYIRRLHRTGTVTSWDPARLCGSVESGKFSLKASWTELGAAPSRSASRAMKARSAGEAAGRPGGSGDGAGPLDDGPRPFVAMDLAPPPETGVPGSLMLVGSTVEEALDVIEREIDRAIVQGRPNLTIIHGRGTGRLKAGIAGYLRRHPRVRGFTTPEKPPGRGGVTEVLLEA
ncbi:MAG: Smr/MutS family protein [Deltaproteobacteria bacterium]|nr:Smr/MutS family protein [Deltaproteobacteria bacterium]